MLISISPRKSFDVLLMTIAVLTGLHAGTRLLIEVGVNDNQWFDLFNMDHERTLPTFYSVIAIVWAAALLGLVAYLHFKTQQAYHRQWATLSAVFVFLALDEALVLHERLITPTLSWTVPYAVGMIALAAYFYRFVFNLPVATRWRFVIAGMIFVVGAMGMEIPGGYVYNHHRGSVLYLVLVTAEEVMEMVGIAFFIYAIKLYLTEAFPALQIQIEPGRALGHETGVVRQPVLVDSLSAREQPLLHASHPEA